MNNLIVLSRLIQLNPNYKSLTIQGGTLQFEDKKINISNLNLDDIAKRHNIYSSIDKISPKDFFNICVFCSNNIIALSELIKLNPNFNNLFIIDNKLKLNDKELNLENLCLGDLIERLGLLNSTEITSEQLFDICELYVNKEYIKNKQEVVYIALNNNDFSKQNIITIFNNYMLKVNKYEQFLDQSIKEMYLIFIKYIEELERLENKNALQEIEVKTFNASLDEIDKEKKQQKDSLERKLVPKNNITTNGYINMFLITILTIASGITLGAIVFLKFGI